MTKAIGFIGAGQMGGRIARRFLDAGHCLMIVDRKPEITRAFALLGATIASAPRECATADIVALMVVDGAQVREACLGKGGLIEGVDPSKPPLVIFMSTISPAEALDIAGALATSGVRTIDAPVAGGLLAAERGELMITVGGESADVELARPVLLHAAQEVVHCGPLGAGQAVKIANNLVGIGAVQLLIEALRIGLANGISLESLGHVMDRGSGRTQYSRNVQESLGLFALWADNLPDFKDLLRIMAKDVQLAEGLARSAGIPSPFASSLSRSLAASVDEDVFENWRTVIDRTIAA